MSKGTGRELRRYPGGWRFASLPLMLVAAFCFSQLLLLSSLWAGEGRDGRLLFLGNRNIAPIVYLEDGRPVGVVVDIVRALAPHLPWPVEIRAMDWQEAQTLVAGGEADALVQINPTNERLKIYDFSDPLLESRFSIFVAADRVGISGISSLYGLTAGVESGGLPRLELAKEPQISLRIIPDFAEGFHRILEGTLDAVVVDYRVGSYVLAEQKIRGIKVSGEPIAVSYSAIAVKKGDIELLAAINKALQSIRSDGAYQQALAKWQPTEAIFQTREQILHKWYVITSIGFFSLLVIAVLWLATVRRELSAKKAAKERLRDQYSTLRGIIDSANTPIFSVDSRYCYTSFNKSHATVMENIYGARIALGQRLLDYMTVDEDRKIARRNLDRALAGEYFMTEAYSGETLRSRQYFQVSHNPVRDEAGTVIGIAVFAQDMTERNELEEDRLTNLRFFENMDRINRAIQGTTNNLEQMMHDVLEVVFSIFDCDRSWLFYPCDPDAPSFRVPMEIAKPEYPGAGILNVDMPMPPEMARNLREVLDSDGPVTYATGTEKTINKVSAEQFDVQSQMMIALYTKTGKPWVFGLHQCSDPRVWTADEQRLFQEIGRRLADALTSILMYRNLLESEKRFSTLINQAADTFVLHDMEGRILDVNRTACESLGYIKEELLTMSVADIDAEFISHEHVQNFWSKLTTNQPVTLEGRHKRKDGTTFPVEVRLGLLQIEKRQVILALARDITERKSAEEALRQLNEELEGRVAERTTQQEKVSQQLLDSRQALMNLVEDLHDKSLDLEAANSKLRELDRLKSMFIASMSHELRTPLNSIIGFTSILIDEWAGPINPEQKQNLAIVQRSGKHLLTLINDVIDVSKIEAGMVESSSEEFDLGEVIDEAINSLAREIQDKGLACRIRVETCQMHSDRRRLLQCLLNLLSNAMKFTVQGKICLLAGPVGDGRTVKIAVCDTGIGIRPEDMDRLFQPFVRLDSPLKSRILGTGLGLYLTKKLTTQLLGGRIAVSSIHGQGSRFVLRIPVNL